MRLLTLACLLGLAWVGYASPAAAQADPANAAPLRPAILKKPPAKWRHFSTGGYYPERASRMQTQGVALIVCKLLATGRLQDCRALDHAPKDFGFDEAALRMAQDGWLTAEPRVVDGASVDGELVRVLVRFQMGRKAMEGQLFR